jgi:hypothetical protein
LFVCSLLLPCATPEYISQGVGAVSGGTGRRVVGDWRLRLGYQYQTGLAEAVCVLGGACWWELVLGAGRECRTVPDQARPRRASTVEPRGMKIGDWEAVWSCAVLCGAVRCCIVIRPSVLRPLGVGPAKVHFVQSEVIRAAAERITPAYPRPLSASPDIRIILGSRPVG